MNRWRVCISSPQDRERLVAEILYDNNQVAEINQENDYLLLEVYPPSSQPYWSFNYEEFVSVLSKAKNELLGN